MEWSRCHTRSPRGTEETTANGTVKVEIFDGNLIRGFGKNRETVIFEDFIFEEMFILCLYVLVKKYSRHLISSKMLPSNITKINSNRKFLLLQ